MDKANFRKPDAQGFTLIEVIVALAVSGILLTAIYTVLESQHRSYLNQQRVVDMQQSVRSAMFVIGRDINSAGFDPTGDADAQIMTADSAVCQISADHNADGGMVDAGTDPNEQVRYALSNDTDGNGIADGAPCSLGREVWGGGLQPVADNIDALNFVYFDADNNVLTTPVAKPEEISSIQVTLVARLAARDLTSGASDTTDYQNQQGTVILPAPNDHFRRIRLTKEFRCRNSGLN